jgi:hypothetical protein
MHNSNKSVPRRFPTRRAGTVALALAIAGAACIAATATLGGCGDGACLEDQENCTEDYVADKYGDDRDCCDDLVCSPGPISNVLICQ